MITSDKTKKGILVLDPRTKLFLLTVISLLALVGHSGPILTVRPYIILLPFLLLALSGKVTAALKWGIIYYFAVYWENILFFLPQGFWTNIMKLIMAVISSFLPSIVMGWYTVFTTTVNQFMAAMEKLHLSQKITIPFVVLFRFFPTIAEEYHSIQDAMRMRGIGISRGLVTMLEYRMVPLMISIVKIGDDLSAAAMTRGLGGEEKRTNFCQIGFCVWDCLLLLIGTGVLTTVLWEKIL